MIVSVILGQNGQAVLMCESNLSLHSLLYGICSSKSHLLLCSFLKPSVFLVEFGRGWELILLFGGVEINWDNRTA
uniref:Uncharacterized protein n=1 Tax=Physcomitrium patens TaxID=3218 RepID=A0A2K1J9F4_PHYPA|nr:hypothetical protein PHYPA_021264 [Physcomitrium patens]